jgi:hypothetical protein
MDPGTVPSERKWDCGIIYKLVMTNIAMENPPVLNR